MTTIMTNTLNVSKKYQFYITFEIFHDIFAIIWSIVRNVKYIKHDVIRRIIFCNSFSFRRFFFTSWRWISYWRCQSFSSISTLRCRFYANFLNVLFSLLIASYDLLFNEKKTLFDRLNITNWKLFKTIIFDRDKKFLFELWIIVFKKLDVKLLYSTTYYV